MRFHNIFLSVLLGLILLLFNLLVIMEVAYAMPPKSGDMIKFIENNPPIESPSTPFIGPSGQKVTLRDFKKTWTLINFWATWCAPCIEEMPSLNRLQANTVFNNLKIIPINVGRDNVKKSKDFYKKLKINNLEIYFDKNVELANKFLLRGLPTTVFINKKGEEFARVIGFVNFDDKAIIKWLQKYD